MTRGTRTQIVQLHCSGLPAPEIARQLDLAPSTVDYHLGRAGAGGEPDTVARGEPAVFSAAASKAAPEGSEAVRAQVRTRDAVAALLQAGVTRTEIARQLGLSKATISYHARRLDLPIDARCARRYDWEAIQRYYDEGHSVRDCIGAFGFSSASWFDAVKRGAIVARTGGLPIEELLRARTYRGRRYVKLRLIREGLKRNVCEKCGPSEWQGAAITLALHHVNGVRNDNRLENLGLPCPNCHSQTDTFAGRNGATARSPPNLAA
jgi:DNA-binding CsgD family transcriptional regulator